MPSDHTYHLHDSGQHHRKPFITGLLICLAVGLVALFFTGLVR